MHAPQMSRSYLFVAFLVLAFIGPAKLLAAESSLTAEAMAECAGVAVSLAKKADNVTLDYSTKSLEYVDKTVNYLRTLPIPKANIDTIVGAFGCYVGEVFVRNLSGAWYFPSPEEQAVLAEDALVKLPKGIISNPIGKVRKLMHNGLEDSVAGWYRWNEEQLRR